MNAKNLSLLVFTTSTLTSLLTSCAGPENIQEKMARYTPKNLNRNQVPEIKISNFNFKVDQKSGTNQLYRAPASSPEAPSVNEGLSESNPTNKKLYFLTLYSQFEYLKKYTHEFSGPTISICPNFHTSLLRHNNGIDNEQISPYLNNQFSYDYSKLNDEKYVASYPELSLPLSKEENTPRVIDILKNQNSAMNEFAINELVHKALDIHLVKTYSEIRELCEYGSSDNYYIYENLITHIKSNDFTAESKNMNTLLKTTLFSNLALMSSLNQKTKLDKSGRSIATTEMLGKEEKTPYANEVMARLNVTWAKQYFDYIKSSH